MQTHEYKTVTVDFDKVAYWSNRYAKDNWRVVAVYKDAYSNTDQCLVLERPVSDTSTMSRDLANHNI